MTDDGYKLANDRELLEMRRGAVEDLAEYRDNLAAIDAEIRQRGLAHTPTEDEREALATLLDEELSDVANLLGRERVLALADVALGFRRSEPQGEPSDAEVREVIRQTIRGRGEGEVYADTLAGVITRALTALRAAGGVR